MHRIFILSVLSMVAAVTLAAGCWTQPEEEERPGAAPHEPEKQAATTPPAEKEDKTQEKKDSAGQSSRPPAFRERREERRQMVEFQIENRTPAVNDERVLKALKTVPRHEFVLDEYADMAYSDTPLPIGAGQTISQPYIVGLMTERLGVESGHKVLEVGTGSGYQAAVLAEMGAEVYTVEIVESLARKAEKTLGELGYEGVHVRHGDGFKGWEEHAPFDRIIVTAATEPIPPPLIEQLKKGGKMVIPVGGEFEIQYLMAVTKTEEGQIRKQRLIPVRFVPMTGEAQER